MKLLALPANITVRWEGLPRTNIQILCQGERKKVYDIDTWMNLW
jgi:hypothetical protein